MFGLGHLRIFIGYSTRLSNAEHFGFRFSSIPWLPLGRETLGPLAMGTGTIRHLQLSFFFFTRGKRRLLKQKGVPTSYLEWLQCNAGTQRELGPSSFAPSVRADFNYILQLDFSRLECCLIKRFADSPESRFRVIFSACHRHHMGVSENRLNP